MSPGTAAGGTSVLPVVARLGLGRRRSSWRCSAPLWAGHLFGDRALPWTALLVAGVVLFPVHCAIVGIAAGRGRWWTYALLVALEPLARLRAGGRRRRARRSGRTGWSPPRPWPRRTGWCSSCCAGRTWAGGRGLALDRRGFVRRILGACSASAASAVLHRRLPGAGARHQLPTREFAAAAPLIAGRLAVPRPAPGAVERLPERRGHPRDDARAWAPCAGPRCSIAAGTAVGMVAGALRSAPGLFAWSTPTTTSSGATVALLVLAAGLVCLLTLTGAASAGPGPPPALRAGLGGGQPRRGRPCWRRRTT